MDVTIEGVERIFIDLKNFGKWTVKKYTWTGVRVFVNLVYGKREFWF